MQSRLTDKLSSHITAPGWSILFFSLMGIFLSRVFALLEVLVMSICGVIFVLLSFVLNRYGAKISARCSVTPVRARCYDTATLKITLNSKNKISRLLEIKNIIPENPEVESINYVMDASNKTDLGGGAATMQIAHQIPTHKRGIVNCGPLVFQYTDPFGLAKTSLNSRAFCTLLVNPYIYSLTPPNLDSNHDLENEFESTSYFSQGMEFYSLKDYQPGDDLKLIHWGSSAKYGNLMIRQNIATTSRALQVLIFLDNRPGTSGEVFEEMVSAAASLAYASQEDGYDVHLVTADGKAAVSNGYEIQDFLSYTSQMPDTPENQLLTYASLGFITNPKTDISIAVLGNLHPEEEKLLESDPSPQRTKNLLVFFGNSVETNFPSLQVPATEHFQQIWEASLLNE